MADAKVDAQNYTLRFEVDGTKISESSMLVAARFEDGFNMVASGSVEFMFDGDLKLTDVVGKSARIVMKGPGGEERKFPGVCISAELLDHDQSVARYRAEIRSWLWFMTQTQNSRVFQELSPVEVFEKILKDNKYDGDVSKKLFQDHPTREYLVQYRETDLEFVRRIFEQEGIFFFISEKNGKDCLTIADDKSAFEDLPGGPAVNFINLADTEIHQEELVYDWAKKAGSTTGKVTLSDYNFETPTANLQVKREDPKGTHQQNAYEVYDYPGRYRDAGEGERLAKIRMKAHAAVHETVQAKGTVESLTVGGKFQLKQHPVKAENGSYVTARVVHQFKQTRGNANEYEIFSEDLKHESLGQQTYRVLFEALPDTVDYAAPQVTPWPEIPGVQTAVVVGPKGDEIYTDKYGRVKIQFHWDRDGKKDQKSSCWVRCMTPWAGQKWGMIQIPRIKQEVVVQFEDGDPDRPLVVGMLYNADNMPPYGLPDNMTQSGLKTNSSKGGGGCHELMFEDKAGAELVRFQSERDYKQIVKNNAEITIGLEHGDKGDLTQKIKNNKTEDVGKDKKVDVGGKLEEKIGSSHKEKVGTSLTIEAGTKIELKVGGSSLVIDHKGVTVKGPMITVDGKMTQVKGSGMLILKGGMTMIN